MPWHVPISPGMVWDGMGWYGMRWDGMGPGMVWALGWYGPWDGMGPAAFCDVKKLLKISFEEIMAGCKRPSSIPSTVFGSLFVRPFRTITVGLYDTCMELHVTICCGHFDLSQLF